MSNDLELVHSWRDHVAQVLCNWILRHVATTAYRTRIQIFIRAGMEDVYGGRLYQKYAPETDA